MSAVATPVISHANTRPPGTLPHLQDQRRVVTICSVFPMPRYRTLRHVQYTPAGDPLPMTQYEMAPAPRGSYSLLHVYETSEWVMNWSEAANENTSQMDRKPISAEAVANDLMGHWSGHTIAAQAGHGPGIGILAGDSPTEAELKGLKDKQVSWFQWLIQDANDKHIAGEGKNITDVHRFAAKWMLDKGAERLPWYPKTEFSEVKNCIGCGKQINVTALRCEFCSVDLPEFYTKYGISPTDDPVVTAFLDRVTRARTPAAVEPPVQLKPQQPGK